MTNEQREEQNRKRHEDRQQKGAQSKAQIQEDAEDATHLNSIQPINMVLSADLLAKCRAIANEMMGASVSDLNVMVPNEDNGWLHRNQHYTRSSTDRHESNVNIEEDERSDNPCITDLTIPTWESSPAPMPGAVGEDGCLFKDSISTRDGAPGVVAMVNSGPNSNGSQFYITTIKTAWVDGEHVVFGRVIQEMDYVYAIEGGAGTYNGKPRKEALITDFGEIPKEKWGEDM